MSLNFNQWIKQQTKRDDGIGDIARDIRDDRCWPGHSKSKKVLHNHLALEHNASPRAIAAFERAFKEWQAYTESTELEAEVPTERIFLSEW